MLMVRKKNENKLSCETKFNCWNDTSITACGHESAYTHFKNKNLELIKKIYGQIKKDHLSCDLYFFQH